MDVQAMEGGGAARFSPIHYDEGGDPEIRDLAIANIAHARGLGLPTLERLEPHERKFVVVARAPSVLGFRDQIAQAKREGATIFAINDAHDWLIENGIVPDGFVIFEVSAFAALSKLGKHRDVTYYIASHCHPQNFGWLDGHKRVLWHCINDWPGAEAEIARFGNGAFMVGGGSTTMLRTLSIGLVLGFRKFDLYGVDSSYKTQSHGIGPSRQADDGEISVIASGVEGFKPFRTRHYLARQADEFRRWCAAFGQMTDVKVFGDGLIPYIHRSMFPNKYED